MISVLSPLEQSEDSLNGSDLPHVLLVLDQFPKTLGGGERMVLRLAKLLPQFGYRASILTFLLHPECDLGVTPCPVYVLPLDRTYDLKALRAAIELKKFIRNQRIQIVQTFFESSDIWAGLVTKALSDAKLISSRRDMGILRSRKHSIAYRLMAGVADAVICVSEEVRRYCIEVDHINPDRLHTIYNGIDISNHTINTGSINPGPEVHVTTIGNVRRVKGHDIFIRAAALLAPRFPGVRFSIAGEILEQQYFAELQELVRQLNIGERLHFLGGVKEIQEHLSRSDIFVLPSRSEGFSNAIVEAMAASLPVVATQVGGNGEAVEHGTTGFIVPPENPEAMSDAIERLLAHPTQMKAMGNAGRNRALEKFTTEAMMARIIATYKQVLA